MGTTINFAPDDALLVPLSSVGAASGVAPLDSGAKVPQANLPAISITDTFVVASQAAMLALTAQRGDVAIRTDLSKSFILSTDSPGTLADWKELLTPVDAVTSVAGRTGVVTGAQIAADPAVAAPITTEAAARAAGDATNAAAVAAETAARLAAALPVLGCRLVVTGDSTTAANSDAVNNSIADSWATHAILASAGWLQYGYNAGHGGYTSTQLLALFDTEILAKSPGLIGVMWGTNDTLDGSNQPVVTAANDKAAVTKARTASVPIFFCTIPPQGMAALPTPSAPAVTVSGTGGTLPAGNIRYKVTSVNALGETLPSAAVIAVTTGATSSVSVDVTHVEGATSYKIYRESSDGSGVYGLIATQTGSGQGFITKRTLDTGSVAAGVAPPGANTTAQAYNAVSQRKIKTINAWRRRFCAARNIPLVDFHGLLVDPATGLYKTGYTTDGTHPTTTRQKYMGQAVWTALRGLIPSALPPITQDNADPLNMLTNGCFITGGATLPTGWSSYGGSASGFTDTNGARTGFLGNALTATRTIPDARFHDSPSISTGFSAGDTILVSFVIEVTGSEAGGGLCAVSLGSSGATPSPPFGLVLTACDIAPSVWTSAFVVPAGMTNFWIKGPYISCGPMVAALGQLTLYNATTGGFLSTAGA